MESVFFDSNPSIRQFTDNASRANSLLHRAQNREIKTKTSKTAHLDTDGDMSNQANVSSGDMLGSMDFGDTRGGGGDLEFTSYEQSEERREQLKEEALKYNRQQREIQEQEKRMTDFLKALKGEKTEEPKIEPLPQIIPEKKEPPVESAEITVEAELEMGRDIKQDNLSEKNSDTKSVLFDKPEISLPQTSQIQAAQKETADKTVDKIFEKTVDKSAEKVEISKIRQDKPKDSEALNKRDSQWNSLLSFDDGFLIANIGADSVQVKEEQAIVKALDYSNEIIELPQNLGEITQAVEKIIDGMLLNAPSTEYIKSVLYYQLSSFKSRILKLCSDFGVKIKLKTSSLAVEFPQEKFLSNSACAYISAQKLCVLDENVLTHKEEALSSRLFMAMAFDHALGKDNFSSLKSPAVLSNYGLCRDNEPGHMFCDSFSANNPVNYFAQSLESYLRKDGDTVKSCIYNNEELYDYDRSMYMYIEYLFKEINRS